MEHADIWAQIGSTVGALLNIAVIVGIIWSIVRWTDRKRRFNQELLDTIKAILAKLNERS